MFENILVPLDGSPNSLTALLTAIQIAKKFDGKITLIHVYSVGIGPMLASEPTTLTPPNIPLMSATDFSEVVKSARKNGAKILEKGKERVKSEGVPVETLLKEGHSVGRILQTVKTGKFDLIVMGARGVSKIREILLGSVTDGVIRNSPSPVLVTK